MQGENGTEPKVQIPIRISASKKQEFEDLYPWYGSLSQFFTQALDEFLELSKGQKTPAQLTTEATRNVVRKSW